MTGDVRDVRADVRANVRAETLAAVGVCGTCGQYLSCGRAHDAGSVCFACIKSARPRTYTVPHVPHVPHVATAATLSGYSLPARQAAHTARPLARVSFPAYGLSKEMKREGLAA